MEHYTSAIQPSDATSGGPMLAVACTADNPDIIWSLLQALPTKADLQAFLTKADLQDWQSRFPVSCLADTSLASTTTTAAIIPSATLTRDVFSEPAIQPPVEPLDRGQPLLEPPSSLTATTLFSSLTDRNSETYLPQHPDGRSGETARIANEHLEITSTRPRSLGSGLCRVGRQGPASPDGALLCQQHTQQASQMQVYDTAQPLMGAVTPVLSLPYSVPPALGEKASDQYGRTRSTGNGPSLTLMEAPLSLLTPQEPRQPDLQWSWTIKDLHIAGLHAPSTTTYRGSASLNGSPQCQQSPLAQNQPFLNTKGYPASSLPLLGRPIGSFSLTGLSVTWDLWFLTSSDMEEGTVLEPSKQMSSAANSCSARPPQLCSYRALPCDYALPLIADIGNPNHSGPGPPKIVCVLQSCCADPQPLRSWDYT